MCCPAVRFPNRTDMSDQKTCAEFAVEALAGQEPIKIEPMEFWYRFDDVAYAAPFDETGSLPGTIEVELRMYKLIRRTPKGAWIAQVFAHVDGGTFTGSERFVLDGAKKRFACPTIEAAKQSFIARKQRQIDIYQARIHRANVALSKLPAVIAKLPPIALVT